jgi:hypothetical protein
MIKLIHLLEYNDIFEDEVHDYTSYLLGIGKKEIVKFCSYFISTSIFGQETSKIDYQINNWFSKENQEIQNNVKVKIKKLDSNKIELIHVFNILKIFEYILKNGAENTEISNKEFEIQIFKGVLALNHEFNQHCNKIIESTEVLDNELKDKCKSLAICFCYYDLIYFNLIEQVLVQFIKAYFFFKFLENYNNKTKAILQVFYSNQGVSDWRLYLKKYFPIFILISKTDNTKPLDILVRNDNDFNDNCNFLDNLILNDEQIIDDFDFITTRSKPFYRTESGKYRIIHPLFAVEKLYNGLYFTLSNINSRIQDKFADFRGIFSSEFSEKYLVYEILNRSFPKKYIKFTGQEIKDLFPTINSEPDYYVRSGNKLYLFESKDVLIAKEIKQSNDFKKIESGLRSKFYYYNKNGIRKDVGIMQLLNNIKRILQNQCSWDNLDPDHIYIYPIILVHYNIYSTPYINFLVNKWFKDELTVLKNEGFKIDKIKDLVIIDINTFLLNHERFQNKSLCLSWLINEYNKSEENTSRSFSKYTYDYILKKKYNQPPKLFRELGINLINDNT